MIYKLLILYFCFFNFQLVFAFDWQNIQLPDYIKASNTGNDDRFGTMLAISGNTMVVGSPREDSNGSQSNNSSTNSGAVYVYEMTANGWQQQAYLKASNLDNDDAFGTSVAIDGDTIVVGAIGESSNAVGVNGNQSNNSSLNSGAVYVFTKSANTWSQQAYLKASNTNAEDLFGTSVAIEGNKLVIGAIGESSNAIGINGTQNNNSKNSSGAIYVFNRIANTWSQEVYIKASNTDTGDHFGQSVALSNDTIAVGAEEEESNALGINGDETDNSLTSGAGAVYVFTKNGNSWSQQAYIKPGDLAGNDVFGKSVAIDKDNLIVGAWGEDTDSNGNSASFAGAAYAYARENGVWSQITKLKAMNSGASDSFGWSVAINGQNLIIGANGEDSSSTNINGNGADNSLNNSGAAYVFSCINGNWEEVAYIKASNTGFFDEFGYSVAISDGLIVVAAYRESSNSTGINGNQDNNSGGSSGSVYTYLDDVIFRNGFEQSACLPQG